MSKTRRRPAREEMRCCFKTPQPARYEVMNRFKMLIYSRVNGAFSPIYVLSRTHLMNFKTASKGRLKKTLGLKGRAPIKRVHNYDNFALCQGKPGSYFPIYLIILLNGVIAERMSFSQMMTGNDTLRG
jgi:hypothetical protein